MIYTHPRGSQSVYFNRSQDLSGQLSLTRSSEYPLELRRRKSMPFCGHVFQLANLSTSRNASRFHVAPINGPFDIQNPSPYSYLHIQTTNKPTIDFRRQRRAIRKLSQVLGAASGLCAAAPWTSGGLASTLVNMGRGPPVTPPSW